MGAGRMYLSVKRLIDVVVSATALVLLAPVMLIVAVLVRVVMGGPVLFRQERPGVDERIFTLYKFRTMTDGRDEQGNLLPDGERLTRPGRFLRRFSLDELPQLWNVLRGDMSLVGPRPLIKDYLPFYNERQRRRHSVRPGITGWAQVNGRNLLTWEERFDLDVWYVQNRSLWLDIRIVLKTFVLVLTGRGVSQTDTTAKPGSEGKRWQPREPKQ